MSNPCRVCMLTFKKIDTFAYYRMYFFIILQESIMLVVDKLCF